MKKTILSLLAAAGLLGSVSAENLVDNTLMGYATGRIGSQSFSSAAFVVSSVADSSSVITFGRNFTLAGLSTIQIQGIGTAVFNGGDSFGFTSIYLNPSFQSLQFQDLSSGNSIFEVSLMSQPSYPDLSTPISSTGSLTVRDGHASPVMGDGIYSTSLGNLEFSSAYGTYSPNATFSTTAVPEPSTYALFGFGALALVVAYRRKVA